MDRDKMASIAKADQCKAEITDFLNSIPTDSLVGIGRLLNGCDTTEKLRAAFGLQFFHHSGVGISVGDFCHAAACMVSADMLLDRLVTREIGGGT